MSTLKDDTSFTEQIFGNYKSEKRREENLNTETLRTKMKNSSWRDNKVPFQGFQGLQIFVGGVANTNWIKTTFENAKNKKNSE